MKAVMILMSLLAFTGVFVSCSKPVASKSEPKTLYTCGMHPQIIQDHPGDCPICGMHLVPVRKQAGGVAVPKKESAVISVDPVTVQNMGIRTDEVKSGPLNRVVRMVGNIEYDETALTDVTLRYKGWIERLFVDATGQAVKKGDPLLEIYAPELVTAQSEYLIALGAGAGSADLKTSALRRLRYFDVSADQVERLERTRKVERTLIVRAPSSGVVAEKLAVAGQMAAAGMRLYRIADLSRVWVQSQVYEQDLPYVRVGQEAEMSLTYMPGRRFQGRVSYIYPTLDVKTRTGKVRMEFANPGLVMKPGMFAGVELKAGIKGKALLVPDSAVLRSGERDTVFVSLDGGRFEPRVVRLGLRGEGGKYEVLSGLKEGERVVVSGQFLLDSESQLKEAVRKMSEPSGGAMEGEGEGMPEMPKANEEHRH